VSLDKLKLFAVQAERARAFARESTP